MADSIDPNVFRTLITRNGGEVVKSGPIPAARVREARTGRAADCTSIPT